MTAEDNTYLKQWVNTKRLLQERMDPLHFENWILQVMFSSRVNGTVRLAVPSRFIADWISKNFQEQLGQAIWDSFGEGVGFELEIDERLADSPQELDDSSKARRKIFPARSKQVTSVANRPFVICDANRLAHAAVLEFVQGGELSKRGALCIYGEPGCGKSHLVEVAIAVYRTKNPSALAMLEDGPGFTGLFIAACQSREGANEFHRKRARCNLLIIDEVQYLAGNKKATQAELVAIWNEVIRRGGKIIIVSQKAPALIEPLSRELASRLLGTIALPMSMPDGVGRMKVLEQILVESELMGTLSPKPEVLRLLIETPTDTRELIGLASSLFTEIRLLKAPMEAEAVKVWLKGRLPEGKKVVQLGYDTILAMTANHFSVTAKVVKENSRRKEVVVPRQVAMFLCQRLLPNGSAALTQIGHFFGKDHTTVLHSVERVKDSSDLLEQAGLIAKKLGCTL